MYREGNWLAVRRPTCWATWENQFSLESNPGSSLQTEEEAGLFEAVKGAPRDPRRAVGAPAVHAVL